MPPTGFAAARTAATSTTASSSGAPPKASQPSLADENEKLRRENQELRQQLLHIVAAAAPPTSGAADAMAQPFWLEAQLKHARRQVQLLSDALCLKAEITADLEQILRDMLKAQPPPSAKDAQFCRGALRKLRGVEFAESVADEIKQNAPPVGGKGRGAPPAARARMRSSDSQPAPARGPPGAASARPAPASGGAAAAARRAPSA